MSKISIYLDGGAVLNIEADEFTVTKDGMGHVKGMSWVNAHPRILRLNVDSVIAVIAHDEPDLEKKS